MDEKSNIAVEKRNIRKRILSLRNEMTLKQREEKSNIILKSLYDTEQYKKAEIILTYADYQSEVITTPLITGALTEKKQVFAPRVYRVCRAEMKSEEPEPEEMESEEPESEEMEFFRISGIGDLAEGYKGIREPICGEGFMEKIGTYKAFLEKAPAGAAGALMLLPGAVFDKYGHRIGYGKGFYDRYLKRLSEAGINVYKIALCYECQLLSEIPHENHDINVDMIITENGFYSREQRAK